MRDFQNLVAADVRLRKSSRMARTDVRGYGVLKEAHWIAIYEGFYPKGMGKPSNCLF